MNKKVLSLILTLIIVLGSLSFVSASSDIRGHWAEANIDYLIQENIVQGDPDGKFRPEDSITRAEFIRIINKALDFTKKGQANFKDVCEDCWFYDDILIAKGENYVDGYPDNTVKPNGNITREEASVMLGRALQINEVHTSSHRFKDSNKIHNWARGYVNAIHGLGYMTGYPDGSFKPQANLKRSEAATLLIKVMDPFIVEEAEVFRLVNLERQKAGLKSLKLSIEISNVARDKSKDMAYRNYFDHISPTFGSPFDMMRSYGIEFTYAAENIAKGYETPQSVMTGWMNSSGHKRNILNSNYNKIGIGYHKVNGTTYWTQMFTN